MLVSRQFSSTCRHPAKLLEPGPHPHHEADAARILARGAGKTPGIAALARPFDAALRREFLHDLVTQAKPEPEIRKPPTHAGPGHILQRHTDPRHRLKDQLLGATLVGLTFATAAKVPLVR